MPLTSSTQPSSTRRWPWAGSRPVVSVSRTISRIVLPLSLRARRFAASRNDNESLSSPFWHLSHLRQNFTHLRPRRFVSLPAIHDEIGARALVGVRHLLGQQRVELLLGHARPLHHAGALRARRRRHHHHGVAAAVAAGLVQQRN